YLRPCRQKKAREPRAFRCLHGTRLAGSMQTDCDQRFLRVAVLRFGAAFFRFGAAFLRFGAAFLRFGAAFLRFGAAFFRFGAAFLRFGAAFFRFGAAFFLVATLRLVVALRLVATLRFVATFLLVAAFFFVAITNLHYIKLPKPSINKQLQNTSFLLLDMCCRLLSVSSCSETAFQKRTQPCNCFGMFTTCLNYLLVYMHERAVMHHVACLARVVKLVMCTVRDDDVRYV
ncbi:MAG: hypothetical protein WBQ78_14000, partial [Gammaproteobacteria bacterium]